MRKLLKTCMPSPITWYKVWTIKWKDWYIDPDNAFIWYFDDAVWMTQWDDYWDELFWIAPYWIYKDMDDIKILNKNNFSQLEDWSTIRTPQVYDNIMIWFKRLWIRMSKDNNIITLSITDDPHAEADWFQYYAHSSWTWDDPKECSKFFLWAYLWTFIDSWVLWSTMDKNVRWNLTIDKFYEYAKANPSNNWWEWDIMWFYQRQYICALYMMKYWNPNSQRTIWMWHVWNGASLGVTWVTKFIGMTGNTTTDSLWRAKLFWLEDMRWNYHQFIWWIKLDGTTAYTSLSTYNTDPYDVSWYKVAALWLYRNTAWTQQTIKWNNMGMFFPDQYTIYINSDDYYWDIVQFSNVAHCIVYIWWSVNQEKNAWLFKAYYMASPTSTSYNLSTRLMLKI